MEFLKINDEELKFNHYRVPKKLLELDLSHAAVLLYMLLLDRFELSKKNNWINKNGEIFQYFTREEAAKILKIAQPKTRRAFRELVENKLIFEKRQGQNKPNLIFIVKRDFLLLNEQNVQSGVNKMFSLNEQNIHSGPNKSFIPDRTKCSCNDTDFSDLDFNNTKRGETKSDAAKRFYSKSLDDI